MNESMVTLPAGWSHWVRHLGLSPRETLRKADLPEGLANVEVLRLPIHDYFRLFEATDALTADPLLPLRLGRSVSPEVFSPPIFAALCSPNLRVAVERIAIHKRLVAPMTVLCSVTPDTLSVSWVWNDASVRSPTLLAAWELVLLVELARIGTKTTVVPRHVGCPHDLTPHSAYIDYFGVAPKLSPNAEVVFARRDAERAFLTANRAMWDVFEPALRQKLADLGSEAPVSAQVRCALLECLPAGETSIDDTAKRLGTCRRTLQRRLSDEQLTFRALLKDVRQELATHYLRNTRLPSQEIAFLLGFQTTSSFFRAFRGWTGQTPESVRDGAA